MRIFVLSVSLALAATLAGCGGQADTFAAQGMGTDLGGQPATMALANTAPSGQAKTLIEQNVLKGLDLDFGHQDTNHDGVITLDECGGSEVLFEDDFGHPSSQGPGTRAEFERPQSVQSWENNVIASSAQQIMGDWGTATVSQAQFFHMGIENNWGGTVDRATIFRQADLNGDGVLDQAEFEVALSILVSQGDGWGASSF